jgi:hypothetical protein
MNQYESFVHDNSDNSDVRIQNLEIEHQNKSKKFISELSRSKKEIESLVMQLNQSSQIIEDTKREIFNKNIL